VNSAIVSNDVALVSGVAPVNVSTVWFNGIAYPVTWVSVSTWTAIIPLQAGTNQFTAVGVDIHGQPISGDTNNFSVVFNGTVPSPVGQIVINEIMCNPATTNAQFIELYNRGKAAVDVSGWRLEEGVQFEFPRGLKIDAGGYLVVGANTNQLREAYGNLPIAGNFKGKLSHHGELIRLVDRSSNLVNEVDYKSGGDWFPFRDEPKDGYDSVEWAAALPYADGKVGMIGASYVGATQMLAAIACWKALPRLSLPR
jgi:hypothetical protein